MLIKPTTLAINSIVLILWVWLQYQLLQLCCLEAGVWTVINSISLCTLDLSFIDMISSLVRKQVGVWFCGNTLKIFWISFGKWSPNTGVKALNVTFIIGDTADKVSYKFTIVHDGFWFVMFTHCAVVFVSAYHFVHKHCYIHFYFHIHLWFLPQTVNIFDTVLVITYISFNRSWFHDCTWGSLVPRNISKSGLIMIQSKNTYNKSLSTILCTWKFENSDSKSDPTPQYSRR